MAGFLTGARESTPTGFRSTVEPLVRLKFTILRHSSSGVRLSRVLFWPAAVVATWGAVLLADGADVRHDVLLLVLAIWGVGWMLGPVLASGAGVLRPAFFSLLPVGRRRLGLALLAAACVGYGPAVTVLSLAAPAVHAVDLGGVAALPVALLAVPPLLVFVVALSRTVYALMGSAMGSRLGVTMSAVQYGLLIAGLFTGWLAISSTQQGVAAVVREGLPGERAARVLEVFPTSWPVLAVEAAADGRWAVAFGWLLGLAVAAAAMAGVCTLVLTPRTPVRAPRRRFRPLGSRVLTGRPVLPTTPTGAVVGKELRQWWRDPWRSLELQCGAWTGLFIGVIGLISGVPQLLPFVGLAVALMAALTACNLLGQDGTAVWLTVVGADRGTVRADIRGRQAALLLLFGPVSFVLTAAFTLISGQHQFWALALALLPAVLGSAVGVAVLLSVVAATPGVDPKYRVGPNDAGDVSYQIWFGLYGTLLPVLPTAALAVPALVGGQTVLAWAAVPLGLLNGAAVAWLLGRLAYRRLDARLPETFVRLRYGRSIASQQQPAGNGLLDRMERGAVKGNQERKPVGT
ncbi:hypothetical protein RI138_29340 [Streptomyces sp. C11-1]|uniref:ABC-2 type transport system permease protein n=1 Tax=Streptomyces durocortorensis TaxID=2811104 RepID=A0ABY9W986_9ACTN|nr:hypothetical protein [Streptomyces durocortorensis]WNF30602.1 hypothetical protein RI138_29340 [Streptomyces durocortorensis]